MDKNSNGEAQHLTAVLLEANSKALLTDEDIADDDVGAADDGDDRDGDNGSYTIMLILICDADIYSRCFLLLMMLMITMIMMMLLIS